MTTNAHRRHLSLASTIAIEEVQAIMAATRNVHRHVFVLKSVLSTSNVVNRHLFDEWIASLLSGEHVEFMHTRIQSSATSYGFAVVACSSRPDHAEFARCAGQALAAVCAPIHFGYVGEAVTQAAAHHWQVELAPVVLATRDVLVASRDKPAQRDDEDHLLPFPGELPSWGLSYMLTEFLDLPREVTITIRLFPFMLSKVDTERTVSLKRRLVNGGLHVFEPGVTRAEYAASPELAEPLSRLLTEWIRRPAGYSVDCVLSADEPLPTQALKRLASDVFGKRPVTIHEVTASTLRAPLAFTAAVRADQGIPGLFPALPILPSYGIERHYPAPERMPPSIGGAVLAQTVCGARSTVVTIPDASRSQHVAFFGATGSGKSTAMLRLLSDDMNSPARHGIVVIDPHGSLVHDVLGLVPRDRAQDVVLIDVTDGESVTSFNPLEGMADDPQFARLMADSVQSLIDALFEARDSSGPSMRAHLRSLLLLGTCYKPVGETFMNVQRCIEDVEFFDYLRSKCKDRNVLNGISVLQQSGSSEHGWKAWAPYLMARLSPFVDSPAMKRLINNPQPSVDFNRAVTDGKILLCNISKSVLGETESRIVGNLVLSRVFAAAVKRGALFDRSTRAN